MTCRGHGADVRTIKLTLAYDGTAYVGWQRQATGVSVQGLLESALAPFEGGPVPVVGAGRTDAGVHALGQVASFPLLHAIGPDALVRALNARLPADVRALGGEDAPPGFHARRDARHKTYRYRLLNGPVAGPLEARFAWHVPEPLDIAALVDALRRVEGTHDFAAFQASGSSARTSVRRVLRATASLAPAADPGGGEVVTIELTADGFLRHMVRNIVGTVVEVGRGRRAPACMEVVLAGRDRSAAGATAPPQGLCLVRVAY